MEYKYRFKPFMKKDMHNRSWFHRYISGGFIGSIIRDKYMYMFIFIMFAWWLIFFYLDFDLEYDVLKIFAIDKSFIYFYSTLMGLSGSFIGFLFSTYVGKFISIYFGNFSLFSSALATKCNSRKYLLNVLKWDKIDGLVKNSNYDLRHEFFGVLSDIILYNTSEPYKIHHYMDEGIIPSNLPVTDDMINDIQHDLEIAEKSNGRVPEETTLEVINSKEIEQYRWLSKNGFLDQGNVDRLMSYENSSWSTIVELKRSFRTNMPPMLTQPVSFGFYTMYIILIPLMWKSYGFYVGSLFYLFIISIYFGISSGIRRMKNVFENPDKNPTIHGNSIGWECHNFSKAAFNSFEIYLSSLGLCLSFGDDRCIIGCI